MNDDIQLPGGWEDSDAPVAKTHRARKVVVIALIVVVVLVAVWAVIAAVYLNGLNSSYEKRSVVSLDRSASDGKDPEALDAAGQNILLLGSDKRSADAEKAENVTGQRSDVMMLVHIPADNSGAYIMSFPRDLYIDIPGHGKDRINSALAFGGVPLAVNTAEDYVGVPIDHAVLIDFDGIQGMVDALGGVDVQVPQDFTAQDSTTFTKGSQHMDGATALTFVRERKAFSDGDFQRNRDQQLLLQAIANKIISADTLSSPGKISDTVAALSPFLTTDDGLDGKTLVSMGLGMRNVRGGDLHFLAAPHGDPTTTSGGASVVAADEEGMDELRKALKADDMSEYLDEHDGEK
jgi:LCP family protein required for cell wall assembly